MLIQPWNQISCFQEAWHTFLVSGSQFLPWRSVGVHFSDFVSGAVSRHANVLLVPIVQYLNQMFQSTCMHSSECFCNYTCEVFEPNVSRPVYDAYMQMFLWLHLCSILNQMFQSMCMHTWEYFCDSTCAVFWTKCFKARVCIHGNISVVPLVQYLNQMFNLKPLPYLPPVQNVWAKFRYCGKWAMWK